MPSPDRASLVGHWQFTARHCYCIGALPNEVVTFDDKGGFQFFRDDKLVNEGSFLTSVGEVCSGAPH